MGSGLRQPRRPRHGLQRPQFSMVLPVRSSGGEGGGWKGPLAALHMIGMGEDH